LAVFLAGLGLGSAAGSLVARNAPRPRLYLGWCQMLLAAAMAYAAWMLTSSLPYWPVNPSLNPNSAQGPDPMYLFQLDLVRSLCALLPATVLWGASFPLALASVAARGQDPGRLVGRVYAANTVGAIVGALGASLIMIAWVGTQQTQRVLIALSSLSGLLLLISSLPDPAAATASEEPSHFPPPSGILLPVLSLLVGSGLAVLLVASVPPVPWRLVALGRYLAVYGEDRELLYMGEGMNASVAVTKMNGGGARNFHISGKIEASTDPQDMRLQRMLGHLPALIHPHPRSILVVGCGAGITAGSFLTYPEVTNVVICEIEPLIPSVITGYFTNENYDVCHDPRVRIVFDDARHFVLTTRENFDIITSDPIHPWVKGAATLYTRDYFQLCQRRLNAGGLVTQWVPLYESDLPAVKSELATFFDVFPDGTLWSNDQNGEGYDVVLLGGLGPLRIDLDAMEGRVLREKAVSQSLTEVGFPTIFNLLTTYGGRASDLRPWLADAQINRDANLRLQYLAGLAADFTQASRISDSILACRTYPGDLFVGDAQRTEIIRAILDAKSGKK
jgi:spermidine synthase